MNYKKIYSLLILKSKYRKDNNIYYEKHHIIPRCLNGTDDSLNIVKLTAREHFIAHKLLYKIYPDNDKILFTIYMMSNFNKKMTGKFYQKLKIKRKKQISQALTGIKRSEFTKQKISKANKGRLKGEKNPFYQKGHLIRGSKNPMFNKSWKNFVTEEQIKKHSENTSKNHSRHFLNKKHTEDSKNLIRNKSKCHSIIFKNIFYQSIKLASKKTGISRYLIKKECIYV